MDLTLQGARVVEYAAGSPVVTASALQPNEGGRRPFVVRNYPEAMPTMFFTCMPVRAPNPSNGALNE